MSYDPYDPGSDAPRPGEPYDYFDKPLRDDAATIKGRVQAPAIGLIVVGILNLFFALYMIVNAVITTVMPADKLKVQQDQIYEALPPSMRDPEKKTAGEMKMQAMLINWPWTLFAIVASILPLVGGIRMLSLKSYALGLCGAIAAAIPCISVTACCGLGEGIGIWALVVLLNADVKSAFR
ncbi:MAG TPA: hypothetical protein VN688_09050 [Gemmataceae bacterium]|nr:hypothetical protein [Gemmataceae bacterium]